MKPTALSFHPNQKREEVEGGGRLFGCDDCCGWAAAPGRVGVTARESLGFARQGKEGTFLSNPGPFVRADRHLSKGQKRPDKCERQL